MMLLDFFTDINHQSLDLGLSLISFIVRYPNCPLDMTIGIVFVGLKLIVINAYVIVAVCNRDIEKCSAVDRTRFESIRKVFKKLSSSPESLYSLLSLVDTFEFPSKLSIEENEEFIVPDFAVLLTFLSKYASDSQHLPFCNEFSFELMTLESFPFAAHAVIGWASPVIDVVLNICDATDNVEKVAVAHVFLWKVYFYVLDNAIKIVTKSLPDTLAGRQRKVILESSVIVVVPSELVLEAELLT
jgi:hypothetical protein